MTIQPNLIVSMTAEEYFKVIEHDKTNIAEELDEAIKQIKLARATNREDDRDKKMATAIQMITAAKDELFKL